MKVLVTGWFSFPEMGATAGDLMVRDLACRWLQEAGRDFDVALAPPFEGGVDWRTVDPSDYSEVLFVCGPFGNGPPLTEFLPHFREAGLVGLNLTVLHPLAEWNPFSLLLERDSDRTVRPDVSFSSPPRLVPVVGIAFVPDQDLPGAMNRRANEMIEEFLHGKEVAIVRIDTRLDVPNESGLRTPAEVESLIAAMDVMITTRLHGTVLALKNGVPPIPVDPISGGHKLARQVARIGWPISLTVDELSLDLLQDAFDSCLDPASRALATEVARKASIETESTKRVFLEHFKRT
ncbi:MAG: polysaccharide pyruvyl transferase family protein [Actinomycetota bacterium]